MRNTDKITLFRAKHFILIFFKNSFFPSSVTEWNKLDPNLRSAASLNVFKKNLLKFIRPSSVFKLPQLHRNQIPHNITPWFKSFA